jgi:hypothetical protein
MKLVQPREPDNGVDGMIAEKMSKIIYDPFPNFSINSPERHGGMV